MLHSLRGCGFGGIRWLAGIVQQAMPVARQLLQEAPQRRLRYMTQVTAPERVLGDHENRWQDMPSVFNDEILDTFLLSANYQELPQAMVSRFNGLVDRVTLTVPNDPANDAGCAKAIEAIRAEAKRADG